MKISIYNNTSMENYDFSHAQLELGSTATSYEPYTNTAYGCEVDWTGGVLRVDRKFVIVNTVASAAMTGANVARGIIAADAKPVSNADVANVICDKIKTVSSNYQWINNETTVAVNSLGVVVVVVKDITTLVDLQTWLSNNPIQVCYELATPLEIPLTPEVITLLKGENNVWTDSGTSEIEYKVDLNSYIQKLIDEASTQASTLSVSPLSLGRSAVLTSTDGTAADEIEEVDEPVLYDEVKASEDEPIEETEEAEKLPVEDVESVDEADEVEGEPAEDMKAVEDLTVKKEIAEELAETEKVEDIKETEEQESEVEE